MFRCFALRGVPFEEEQNYHFILLAFPLSFCESFLKLQDFDFEGASQADGLAACHPF